MEIGVSETVIPIVNYSSSASETEIPQFQLGSLKPKIPAIAVSETRNSECQLGSLKLNFLSINWGLVSETRNSQYHFGSLTETETPSVNWGF